MPAPPPPLHSRWKPGQSGNPTGRKKAKISHDTLRELIERLMLMSVAEIDSLVADPKTTMIEMQFAQVMRVAVQDGDYSRLSFLLDRYVGKVPDVRENHNHNHDEKLDQEPVEKLYQFLRKA